MVSEKFFGSTSDGRAAKLYTITNDKGAHVVLTDFGARIVSIVVPDRDGDPGDVVLGYDTLAEYETNSGYFGAVVGRCANRLRNAGFVLNGVRYDTAVNDRGVNTLHGGVKGFDKKIWTADTSSDDTVTFCYFSADMEENFPGNLRVQVRYSFNNDNELRLEYSAVSDKDTLLNLTNHAYFNLDGHTGESAAEQLLQLNAGFYCPTNQFLQLTGEVLSVKGTPFDFTEPKRISSSVDEDHLHLKTAGGYDHTFVFNKTERGAFDYAGELYSEHSGRVMRFYTTQPGVQFYSGNSISDRSGKGGAIYSRRRGICLETHSFPDAMHNCHFPSPVLKAGEKFSSLTVYKFSTR